jgi:uncharacterized membrane protein
MLALRYAALLALAVWVGGLITLGAIAAPATFDVLGAAGSEGRLRAATVFGEVLRRFHWLTYGCGAVVVTSLVARAVLGPRPRRFAVRISIAGLMLAASVWIGLVVAPQAAQVQQEIGGLPSSLPETDPRRALFVRLHRLTTTLELVPFVGGLALLFWELKD